MPDHRVGSVGPSCANMYGKGRAIVWTGEGANFGEFGELGGWGGVRKGGLRGRGAELAGDG